MFNCFAYSSSGTPNFLAIATCDGVSLTVLRPDFVLLFADATVCTGLVVSVVSILANNGAGPDVTDSYDITLVGGDVGEITQKLLTMNTTLIY